MTLTRTVSFNGKAFLNCYVCMVFIVIIFTLHSCTTVRDILNSKNISSSTQQYRALQRNIFNLGKINKSDMSINIGAADFDSLLVPSLSQMMQHKQTIEHVKDYSLTNLAIALKREQIEISTDFKLIMDTLNAGMSGNLVGTISYSIQNDSLILYPAFESIHINSLSYKKVRKLPRKVVADILNSVLKKFLGNINGYVNSQIPSMPLNLINREITGTELANGQDVSVTLSQPLKTSTPIFYSSTLINGTGIHILASVTEIPVLPDTPILVNQYNFPNKFAAFEELFSAKRKDDFPGAPSDINTFLVINKATFARIWNTAFENEDIYVTYGPQNILNGKIDKHLDFHCHDIDCGKIRVPCPELHIVPECNDPQFDPCDYHCGFLDVPCKAREEFCQIKIAAARIAWYSAGKPACLLLRRTELEINRGIQLACDAAEIGAKLACESTKGLALGCITGDHVFAIGDIHVNYDLNLSVNAKISALKFNDDLSMLNFSLDPSVNVSVVDKFQFTPQGPIGHMACALSFDEPFNTNVSMSIGSKQDTVTSRFDSVPNGGLNLRFSTNPIPNNTLVMDPTPLKHLTNKFATLINCPLLGTLATLGTLVKTFHDIFTEEDFGNDYARVFFNGKYNYDFKGINLNMPVKPIALKYQGQSINLIPISTPTYLGFYNNRNIK